jgi:hypothetical protein
LSQLLPKYFGGYAGHGPPKLTESERAGTQTLENHRLPSTFYHLNRG